MAEREVNLAVQVTRRVELADPTAFLAVTLTDDDPKVAEVTLKDLTMDPAGVATAPVDRANLRAFCARVVEVLDQIEADRG